MRVTPPDQWMMVQFFPSAALPVVRAEEGERLVELRHHCHEEHRVSYREVAPLHPGYADQQARGQSKEHDGALNTER